MEFNLFDDAMEDERSFLRKVGGDMSAVRTFQTGLRILLPKMQRKKLPLPVKIPDDPAELVELQSILAGLLSDDRDALSHERHLARHAVAETAYRFGNRKYAETVFLWLTMQGYVAQKEAVSQSASEPEQSGKGRFFP
jgi:hypothetical protein